MSSYALSPMSPSGQAAPPQGLYSRRRARGWETTKLLLRFLSMTLFFGILIANIAYYRRTYDEYNFLDIWPWLVLAAVSPALLWDVADMLTLWVRRGRAIAPKAQIGVELCLALAAVTASGVMAWQLNLALEVFGDVKAAGQAEGVLSALLTLTMLTFVVRTFLFARACVDRRRELRTRRSRVVYIEALGEAVFVVAKPNVGFGTLAMGGLGGAGAGAGTGAGRPGSKQTAASVSSSTGADGLTEVTSVTTLVAGPSQAASVTARQRPLMRPPPEGYEPDEAEMARRRRGDAQPQLMVAEAVDMKFSSSVVVNPHEGKFLVESSRSPGVAGESSRSQLRSAPMVEEARGGRPRSWG